MLSGLRHEGFAARGFGDVVGPDAILAFAPDLAVLDVRLPSGSGFALARRLRDRSALSIIFLTARDAVADRVEGLELGADDYVVKPFCPGGAAGTDPGGAAQVRRALERARGGGSAHRRGRGVGDAHRPPAVAHGDRAPAPCLPRAPPWPGPVQGSAPHAGVGV
ncbi:MAG: response regulator [Solirubrobacteraceae bacterium]